MVKEIAEHTYTLSRSIAGKLGDIYEAAIATSLELIGREYTWQPKFENIYFTPDFAIPNEKEPEIVIMVTHHSTASDSQYKFWQEIDEYSQIRTLLNKNIKVISAVFGKPTGWKNWIPSAIPKIFDSSIVMWDNKYPINFNKILKDLKTSEKNNQPTMRKTINFLLLLNKKDNAIHNYFTELNQKVIVSLNAKNNSILNNYTEKEKSRLNNFNFQNIKEYEIPITFLHAAATTLIVYSKRELEAMKLLVQGENEVVDKDYSNELKVIKKIEIKPKGAKKSEAIVKVQSNLLGKKYVIHSSLHHFFKGRFSFNPEDIEIIKKELIKEYPALEKTISEYRTLSIVEYYGEGIDIVNTVEKKVYDKFKKMIDLMIQETNNFKTSWKTYSEMLFDCSQNNSYKGIKYDTNWVLEILCSAASLNPQRFAANANDIATSEGKERPFSTHVAYGKFQTTNKEQKYSPFTKIQSEYLAKAIEKQLGFKKPLDPPAMMNFLKTRRQNFLQTNSMAIPLKTAIKYQLENSGICYKTKTRGISRETWVSQYCQIKKGGGKANLYFEIPLRNGKYIYIHGIASYFGSARTNARNRSGRIRGFRYFYNGEKVVPYEDIDEILMVLDGEWLGSKQDPHELLKILYLAGVDKFFFSEPLTGEWGLIKYLKTKPVIY